MSSKLGGRTGQEPMKNWTKGRIQDFNFARKGGLLPTGLNSSQIVIMGIT